MKDLAVILLCVVAVVVLTENRADPAPIVQASMKPLYTPCVVPRPLPKSKGVSQT